MGIRYWDEDEDEAPAEEAGWLIAGTLWEGQSRRDKLERARRFQEVELADATARHDDVGMAGAQATLDIIDKALREVGGPLYGRAGRKRRRRPKRDRAAKPAMLDGKQER